MHYHCVLKSNWQGNDTVTFLEQLFSIKADFQDAKCLPNSCKVNSLQIIVPFTQCVLLLDYFKVMFASIAFIDTEKHPSL